MRRAPLLLLLLLASPAFAQRQAGSVLGRVTEAGGAGLRGVSVTLQGGTGHLTATTDEKGMYRFPAVSPATYEIRAELAGFEGEPRRGVVVPIAKAITVDLVLRIPGEAETVEVVGERPAVDLTSSFTDNTLWRDLLDAMPLSRTAIDLLNYAPGVNDHSAFGGEARSSNALLLDGVDTRDPEAGSAWIFLDYDWLEEVQVGGLGAPAEYGSYTGAIVNSVTRSGGDAWSGLFDLLYTGRGFGSDNVTADLLRRNPALGNRAVVRKSLDASAQLAGPLVKDKLFVFAGAQRFELDVDPAGPRSSERQVSPRLFLKLSYHPSEADHFTATFERDELNRTGLESIPSDRGTRSQASRASSITDDFTLDQTAPSVVLSAQWQHSFGSSGFGEVKYTGWSGYYDVFPKRFVPAHFDQQSGTLLGSQGVFYDAERGRQQLNASLTRYAEKWGRHDLKFGLEVERSRVRSRLGVVGGFYYTDEGDVPVEASSFGYDVSAHNSRESAYAQDSWRVSERLTLNPGLRLDHFRGSNGRLGGYYSASLVQPRLGLAFDLTGSRRYLLKAHWGRYAEAPLTYTWIDGLPGVETAIDFDVVDGRLSETRRSPPVVAPIDEDTGQPRLDELTVGLEHSVNADLRVSVTAIRRRNTHLIGLVRPQARYSSDTLIDPLTGKPITVYVLEGNPDDLLVTNPEGFRYLDTDGALLGVAHPHRDYEGLMLVVHQRLRGGFQLQGSYVLSKASGTVDNTPFSSIPTGGFGSPNGALIDTEGELTLSRRHELKLLASYQGAETLAGVFVRSLSGQHYAPVSLVLLEPRGSRTLPWTTVVDLRFERFVRLRGNDRLGLFVDVTNLFNAGTVTDVETVASSFDLPLAVLAPRQVTLGARWSW